MLTDLWGYIVQFCIGNADDTEDTHPDSLFAGSPEEASEGRFQDAVGEASGRLPGWECQRCPDLHLRQRAGPVRFRGCECVGSICPPIDEDKMGGFKGPPLPDISDDFLSDTVWLIDLASAEEVLQPRKYVCPECYNDIFTGQTICLSCGYRIEYGTVDMEVDEDEGPAGQPMSQPLP